MEPTWAEVWVVAWAAAIYHQVVIWLQWIWGKQRVLPYCYSSLPLGNDNIRLLRLLPNKNGTAIICCELFDYSLGPSKGIHLYEALSYTWGNPNETLPIIIDNRILPVTTNLHAALSRLQSRDIARTIWVDAVCINQGNEREKEQQIQLMQKVYAHANRVIVWLGEAANNSDQALEEIRAVGSGKATNDPTIDTIQSVLALLQRSWFRRIWVLQEVAAARNISIICGPTEIDGYAFCLGADSQQWYHHAPTGLQNLISSVIFLIKGAIFRPKYITDGPGRVSQGICPLGELVDLYHAHNATKRHDKVYALRLMSSDNLRKANLLPDYRVSWEDLWQRLARFLFSENVSLETWGDEKIAAIKSKGCILGEVSSVAGHPTSDGRQVVDVNFNLISGQLKHIGTQRWTAQPSAKPVQTGDLVCLLQGAQKPTIIRLYGRHFYIIKIAPTPLANKEIQGKSIKWSELLQSIDLFTRDFLLYWDWENSHKKLQSLEEHEVSTQTNNWSPGCLKTDRDRYLESGTRAWNAALILGDMEKYKEAEERLQEAIKGYNIAFKVEHPHTLKSQYGLTPLSWAAGNGYDTIARLLLAQDGVDPDLEDSQYGQTPLSWAAEGGHEAVVRLLLETGKVEVDIKDSAGRTPLFWAAKGGHKAIVRRILETRKGDVDSKDKDGLTPLWWAARGGYEAVVKLLLETDKVEVDIKDAGGRTPLFCAAEGGYEAVVKLLLETGKVEVDIKDAVGRTPLFWAAEGGYEAVVKLLLETGKVEVDIKDEGGLTPLFCAAEGGYEAVVKLLLETGKVEVDTKDESGWTPLFCAVEGGYEAAVKLLLEIGKAEVDIKDAGGRTPLFWAIKGGHEAVIKLLKGPSWCKG